MKQFITMILMLMLSALTQAQTIVGTINDESKKGVVGASVSLYKAKDSTIFKIAVTNNQGKYSFNIAANGKYFVTITSVGFAKGNSTVFEFNGTTVEVPAIGLKKASKNLGEVTVSSKKPMFEVRADKTIFNVEASINAVGSDALDLLRKSPGVMVDKDDNVSLSGKNGVQIYIDGRPSPLAGKELADYLKSIQSSNIEAIELIINPSAKYDAAGNAGIINIRLKKNKAFGTNGSVNAGYAVGVYSKYNAGINLNNRNKKINLFGNYNYNNNNNTSTIDIYRYITDSIFDSKGIMNNKSETHSFKTGLDFYATSKSTFGIIVNGTYTNNDMSNCSLTDIFIKSPYAKFRSLIADNSSNMNNNNTNVNGNYRFVDTSGHELNIDMNYGNFKNKNEQQQPNAYFDVFGMPLFNRNYQMIAPSNIDIANIKADYEQRFLGGKLEAGIKFSHVKTENDFKRYDVIGATKTVDPYRSNNFTYIEKINAAYLNFNKQYKGLQVQVGFRVENTNTKGRSRGIQTSGAVDTTFTRDYTNLFPSAAITINKNPLSQWSFAYSRRIDRPAYQDLNPFEFKLDEYQYKKGNTNLTPQYTNSFGVTHTYKYLLTTQLNYSKVTDVFAQIIERTEVSKSFMTKKNLAIQDIISLNISYPLQKGIYNAYFNVNGYYSHYKADFGVNKVVNLDVTAGNFYMQHSVRLKKGYTAELSSWFSTPSIWEGTFKNKSMGFVDIGISKLIMQGKGNIKLAMSDIFKTMSWSGTSNYDNQYLKASGTYESQQVKLNFMYRFGKNTVKAARQRQTGVEDESKRVKSGGGGFGG